MTRIHARTAPLAVLALTLVLGATAGSSAANQPPLTPTFIEPTPASVVSANDPHFNINPFSDPDTVDSVESSDWEVWDDSLNVRVWADVGEHVSVEHVHTNDGIFEGPLAGEVHFLPNRAYRIRARYRDDSGGPDDYSPWSVWVPFSTAPLNAQLPLQLQDIPNDGVEFWLNEMSIPIDLPDGPVLSTLEVTTFDGLLLKFSGSSGSTWVKFNPPGLSQDRPIFVVLKSNTQAWNLATSRLRFHNQNGDLKIIYLPEETMAPGDSLLFWVNEAGATFRGSFTDTVPDFSTLARDVPIPWSSPFEGIVVERVVSGLYLPVNLAFLPDAGPNPDDAYFYVTELYGKVKMVTRDYTVTTLMSNLLNFNPTGQFAGSGEMGVTGITYSPLDTALFVSLVYDEAGSKFGRVIKAHLAPDRKSVTTVDTVFEGVRVNYSHQVHAVTIGPDSMLYVNIGDGLQSQTAQNLNDLRGKVLRMTRNGAIPPDNPFPGSYIYAYGFRNPFGAAFRPGTSDLYISDNGPNVDDRIAKLAPGSNYGWCCNMQQGALITFNPTVAPTAMTFMPPGLLDAVFDNQLFQTFSGPTYDEGPASVKGKKIWSFALDDTGGIAFSNLFLSYVGQGFGTCVGLAPGDDGLYFTDLYGDAGFNESGTTNASIYRITSLSVAGSDPNPPGPKLSELLLALPNPIHGTTFLRFELPRRADGEIAIFDAQGRLKRRLPGSYSAGLNYVEWNGRDESGASVPSGVYFVKLQAAGISRTSRVVVTR